jgi:hypothetical protein
MRVFFDSSALAKRYVEEAGTREVLAWCERATEVAVSAIAVVEIIGAFKRLARERRLDNGQFVRSKGDFLADLADMRVYDVSPRVIDRAVAALEAKPLRALDALHVGSAVVHGCDVFVSADARQCAAAAHLELAVAQV